MLKKYYLLIICLIFVLLVMSSCSPMNAEIDAQHPSTPESTSQQNSSQVGSSQESTPLEEVVVSRYEQIFNLENNADKFSIWFFSMEASSKAGDSMLLRTPDGVTMLIDSGILKCGPAISNYLKELGIDRLDYATASHIHHDHVAGFTTVLKDIPVDRLLLSQFIDYESTVADNFKKAMKDNKVTTQLIGEGDTFKLGEYVEVEVLNPPKVDEITSDDYLPTTTNNKSVVYKMTYKNNTFIFAGDIYISAELELVENYGEKLDADFIKIPHHGASTSSSKEFVELVTPDVAVVTHNSMADLNVYKRYKDVGSLVYVNALDGNILLTSDGDNIEVITEKDRKPGAVKP